jgi:aminopeptidase N
VINWDYEVGTQTASLKVTQMQKPAIFQFPLDIVLVGAEGGRVRHQLQIEQESQTFKIPMESKPEGFSFDPDVKLLFEVSIIH